MTQQALPCHQASFRSNLHVQCLHQVRTRLRGFTRWAHPCFPGKGGLELDLRKLDLQIPGQPDSRGRDDCSSLVCRLELGNRKGSTWRSNCQTFPNPMHRTEFQTRHPRSIQTTTSYHRDTNLPRNLWRPPCCVIIQPSEVCFQGKHAAFVPAWHLH